VAFHCTLIWRLGFYAGTTDSCDSNTGVCIHTPIDPDDGDLCMLPACPSNCTEQQVFLPCCWLRVLLRSIALPVKFGSGGMRVQVYATLPPPGTVSSCDADAGPTHENVTCTSSDLCMCMPSTDEPNGEARFASFMLQGWKLSACFTSAVLLQRPLVKQAILLRQVHVPYMLAQAWFLRVTRDKDASSPPRPAR
jgi:hypothetical protein